MGLNIVGNVVHVDHNHNRLLSTTKVGNPTVEYLQNLVIYSTFKRHKASSGERRDRTDKRGDNCHLLYALKNKDDLITTFGDIRRLMQYFDSIIEDMVDQSEKYDAVIAMPSKHNISKIYAVRLARRYQCNVYDGVFCKITVEQANQMLAGSPLSVPDKKRISLKLKRQKNDSNYFSLKDVPPKFREHFVPLELSSNGIPLGRTKFLLADDLLATGTTLSAARNIILSNYPSAIVDAACLFSSI